MPTEYITFDDGYNTGLELVRPSVVIKLDSYNHEHYTEREVLGETLLPALTNDLYVKLHTFSFDDGDNGFAKFTVSRNDTIFGGDQS